MNFTDTSTERKLPTLRIAMSVLFGVFLIYIAWWWYVAARWQDKNGEFSGAGTFGDAFGAINALFSGLAMAAVVVTLWISQRQLEVQQKELESSVAEMRAQNAYLAKQAVQTQFFQMLASWQTVVEQVAFIDKDNLYGRAAMNEVARHLRDAISVVRNGQGGIDPDTRRTVVQTMYDRVLAANRVDLGHYFRLLYHIVRFIDESKVLTNEEKKDLSRIVRAHLSDAEFMLLYYNCILPVGEHMFDLVERYDLLQNIRDGSIVHEADLDFYPQTKARWQQSGRQFKGFIA